MLFHYKCFKFISSNILNISILRENSEPKINLNNSIDMFFTYYILIILKTGESIQIFKGTKSECLKELGSILL